MIILRAIVFNILFYLLLAVGMVLILPLFIFPRHIVGFALKRLLSASLLLQCLFGLKVEVRGKKNIPQGGAIIASKHQSVWETFMLSNLFYDPGFVYKCELEKIPLYGSYLRKFDMVPINRSEGIRALKKMVRLAAEKVKQGRQIIIFPEGTRRPAGAKPDYKTGIALLYEVANTPVLPIALNSGLFWSKYFWSGKTGKLVVDILPPIGPGLPRNEFMMRLQSQLEAASNALL
jgi:1-acyl-sn-glycerol-3-phosphate acyltransferase